MDRIKQLGVFYHERKVGTTYSNSLNGEHATTVNGNGTCPRLDDILAVAAGIGIGQSQAEKIAREIRNCVYEMLSEYVSPF